MAWILAKYPDELDADFLAFYGVDWRTLPVWRTAGLLVPLLRRPECELCRVLDPDWMWRDPLFAVVAALAGLEQPQADSRQEETRVRAGASMSADALMDALASPRSV